MLWMLRPDIGHIVRIDRIVPVGNVPGMAVKVVVVTAVEVRRIAVLHTAIQVRRRQHLLIPQQTHDTPAIGTLPVPAIPALPDTASVSTNGIATSVAIDDGIGNI